MKHALLLFSASLLLIFYGCDKIKNPIQSTRGTGVDTLNNLVRKVLLEDYTGQTCGNCPAAAQVAEKLGEQYKDKLVTIAVHAGFFARTKSGYPTSYTTTVGNDWDGKTGFGISEGLGNPNGMINRKDFGGGMVQKESKWSSSVALALAQPYILGLDLKATYDPTSRNLNTTVKAGFKTAYTSPMKLVLVLMEDSIIGPQTDYTRNPDKIPNYVFMHLLRADINGSWGTDLKNPLDKPVVANDTIVSSFSNFQVKSDYNDKHLYLVAFAYDVATKEVLQVEKVKIR